VRLGLSIPVGGLALHEQPALFEEAERLGFTDFWSPETDRFDSFTPLAAAACVTQNARLGTAIANIFTRGPALLAATAASLAELAPGRFRLGLGVSTPVVAERWNGLAYEKPVTRMAETVRFLRQAWAGERCSIQGETLRVDGFRMFRPLTPQPPIYIAALRPRMLAVAGALGDGLLINWCSAADVPEIVSIARKAALDAGRDADSLEVVCVLPTFLVDDERQAEAAARRLIASYAVVPAYAGFQKWLGRGDVYQAMATAWQSGDRDGSLASVPGDLLDDLLIIGDAQGCARKIQRFRDAGVDVPVLAVLQCGDGSPAALAEGLKSLARESVG
jgi:probable F420-dependent oxidoreductase